MNEPAFPVMKCANESGHIEYHKQGMTLRDYFAAKALHGLVVGIDVINRDATAKVAYELADAMLKARGE